MKNVDGETEATRPAFFAKSVEKRFAHDGQGRLVPGPGAEFATVPRFFLGRSPGITLWRFSAALDSECVIRLARLAALEPPLSPGILARMETPPPPERLPAFRERLGGGEAAPLRFNGPLLVFDAATAGGAPGKARFCALAPVGMPPETKRGGDTEPPGVGLEVAGTVVATCRSRHHWPGWGAECAVETTESERGRGYGQAVLRAWCESVRRRGEIPLARPQWSERAGLGLTRSVGARGIGESFEFD